MKRNAVPIILLVFSSLICCHIPAHAQSTTDPFAAASFPGMGSYLLPDLGTLTTTVPTIAPRWESAASASLAVPSGASTSFRNPAGLGLLKDNLVQTEQGQTNTSDNALILTTDPSTYTNRSFPAYAISIRSSEDWVLSVASTSRTDGNFTNYQTLGNFNATFAGQSQHYTDVLTELESSIKDVTIGIGQKVRKNLSWGIAVHVTNGTFSRKSDAYDWSYGSGSYISENGQSTHEVPISSVGDPYFREFTDVYTASISGYGVDMGAMWHPSPAFSVGGVLRNVYANQVVDWTWTQTWGKGVTEKHFSPAEDDIDTSGKREETQTLAAVGIGFATRLLPPLSIAADTEYNRIQSTFSEHRMGAAYTLTPTLTLLGGARWRENLPTYTGGIAFRVNEMLESAVMVSSRVRKTVFDGETLETVFRVGFELSVY